MDFFKPGNSAGTAQHGGVLALCGDDHGAASSTVSHQSEHMMMAAMMPMLNPANVQEFLDYGLLGWAMSRYAGVWVGFKCQTATVESAARVSIDPQRLQIQYPDFPMPPRRLNIRLSADRKRGAAGTIVSVRVERGGSRFCSKKLDQYKLQRP